ncbi:hemolysin family protein [Streptomyces antarcticus]|uniref:hemolysin family protein n=1 Tax=Streptomyces antarcticus TaxID=2996458 RepID=UPI00226DB8FA|nr:MULTISPECIES: hemolysin family protein [unclassified Streptomyces]MCY0946533.1 hemolysin family protein [Streptomyces sp. H34-AA3]MCZ4086087.1 hemolysin family protein [Streptomyces sp. H34-S5]
MSAVLGLLAVLVLTAGTGYFVAQEFAYVAADRLALTREAAAGDKRAARAVKVLERLSFMLSGAQLGITVTGLVVGFLAEPALAGLLRPLLSGVGIPDAAVSGIALFLAFALATVIQMVLGELAPKNLALAIPERLAKSLSASTVAYLKVAGPLIRVFDAAANRILRRIGIEPVEELHHGATLEELGHLIGESHDHGQLPRANADLLESALEFSERRLGEVMVPRVDVDTVPEAASGEEVALLIARRGHSHYPVLGQRTDDVVGIVGVRELMPLPAGQLAQRTARALARPALFLPDSLPLPGAVEQMEAAGEEFAVVLDEHGGLAGIVTFEDIAEELVGEISDESDRIVPLAVRDGNGWLIDASRRIDEAAQATGIALPEDDDFETVAGLVIDRLGRLPVIGDQLTIDLTDGGQAAVEVTAVDRHVPERIWLSRLYDPKDTDDNTRRASPADRSKERPA